MSLLTLLDPRVRIGPITIDIANMEEHGIDITVTSQVVEGVLQVTDHAIVQPQKLRIEGEVLTFSQWRPVIVPGHANRVYKALEEAARLRLPLVVQTRLKTYTNMLIASVRATREPTDYQSLKVSIELQQVLFSFASEASAATSAADFADPGVDLGSAGGAAIP